MRELLRTRGRAGSTAYGRFTPPNLGPDGITGLKLWLDAEQPVGGYLDLPGTTGNYASTPDAAALDITGDIDIRVKVAMDDWTPTTDQVLVAKRQTNQWSYQLSVTTGGNVALGTTADGLNGTLSNQVSSVAASVTNGAVKWVRSTRTAATGVAVFYLSDDGLVWTQLGSNVAGTVQGIHAGTSILEVGASRTGLSPLAGLVYYAEVRNGIDGTVVASPSFNQRLGTTSFTDGSGLVWTINGASSVFVNAAPAESARISRWGDRTANLFDATQTDFTKMPRYLHPGYLRLSGTSGHYVSTPDSAALDIVGDIDIRVKVAMDDWTPGAAQVLAAKRQSAGQYSWQLRVDPAGTVALSWTADGSTVLTATSTAGTGVTNGVVKWVRTTLDVDNGAVGKDVKFWTSDDGVTWTQLGTTVTTALTTSIFSSTSQVEIGSTLIGTSPLAGNLYYADVRNNILNDGTGIVAVADFEDKPVGTTSWTGPQGNVWTVNGASSAFVKTLNGKSVLRFDGVDDWARLTGSGLDLLRNVPGATLFIVAQANDSAADKYLVAVATPSGGSRLSLRKSTTNTLVSAVRALDADTAASLTGGALNTSAHVLAVRVDYVGQTLLATRDGTIVTNTAIATTAGNTSNTASLHVGIAALGGTGPFTGDIAEVIVYDRALSDAERKSVERYLGTKYGITVA